MKWLDRLRGRTDEKDAKPSAGARSGMAPTPRRLQPSSKAATPQLVKRSGPFQAVSIVPCLDACPAANMIRESRFLTTKAPRLPLPDCATPDRCSCRFRKYEDRRLHEQRSPYANVGGLTYNGKEKRRGRGRRKSD